MRAGIVASQLDYDALKFINAAGLTNSTQILAVHYLVFNLKLQGLWTKCNAIYPVVGGTATTHKFNLKDPRDLDAAYRLTYVGSAWTHDANGMLPLQGFSYANTNLTGSTLSNTSHHLSIYSNFNDTSNTSDAPLIAGADQNSYANRLDMGIYYNNSGTLVSFFTSGASGTQVLFTDASMLGLYTGSRTSSTRNDIYKNSTSRANNTGTNSATLPTNNIILGGWNVDTGVRYGYRRIAFASIGSGLSATDVSNLYTIVQQYQTLLSRNV